MNIYIPIEVKAREIESRTLLALAAAERGHVVVLGGKEDTLEAARSGLLKPGILHDLSLAPSPVKVTYFRELLSRGHVITSQDEESGLLGDYGGFARRRFSAETCSMASRVLCWGAYDARTLRELYGHGDHVAVVETGSPRVDFWRPEFLGYYARQQKALTKRFGSYVLVSSNFVRVLNIRRFWDLVRFRRNANQFEDEESEYAMYGESGYLMCVLAEYVRMIRAVATARPEIRVVVRPHPLDAAAAWRVLIGDYPSVVVSREGTLGAWIRGAKLLIHNGCTSGFEAAACGVPRIAYQPVVKVQLQSTDAASRSCQRWTTAYSGRILPVFSLFSPCAGRTRHRSRRALVQRWTFTTDCYAPITSEFEKTVPNAVSYRVDSLAALLDAVDAIVRGRHLVPDAARNQCGQAVLRERFANLDGALGADRIVDEWEQLSSSSLESPNDWMRVRAAVLRRQLRGRMSRALSPISRGRSKRSPSITRIKFPSLGDSEMRTIVSDLQSFLGRFGIASYERLGDRSFIFRRS